MRPIKAHNNQLMGPMCKAMCIKQGGIILPYLITIDHLHIEHWYLKLLTIRQVR